MSNNHIRWQITLVLALSAVSAFLYYIQYRYAGGAEHVLQWLLGSLAFLPVQVLILTLVVDRLLARREKLAMLKKLNMVIGVFFSETATHLLKMFAALDRDIDVIRGDLVPGPGWTARDFARKAERMRRREGRIDVGPADLSALKAFLSSSREFLLGLMANPNLLEHESFTDLLWAVFHLTDELMHREDVSLLPPPRRMARVPRAPPGGLPLPVFARPPDQPLRSVRVRGSPMKDRGYLDQTAPLRIGGGVSESPMVW